MDYFTQTAEVNNAWRHLLRLNLGSMVRVAQMRPGDTLSIGVGIACVMDISCFEPFPGHDQRYTFSVFETGTETEQVDNCELWDVVDRFAELAQSDIVPFA